MSRALEMTINFYYPSLELFSTCMPKGFRCPVKALSYENLSEHGSLDEMNKESRVVPLTGIKYFF